MKSLGSPMKVWGSPKYFYQKYPNRSPNKNLGISDAKTGSPMKI